MINYTSPKQKAEMYSQKYNLPKEEVARILAEHDDVLTLDELKIKYDDPNIGQLPDWLSEEELSNMIWKTIHRYWNYLFAQRMTKEDLYNEHQIYIRKKIKQYKNFEHIKGSLVKRMLTLIQEFNRKGKYFTGSLDEPIQYSDNDIDTRPKFNISTTDDSIVENDLFIEKIKSIKDKSIRNLLIITGYLVCEIDELRLDYIQVLRSVDKDIQNNIKFLEQVINYNDELCQAKIDKKSTAGQKIQISIKDVIEALNLNVSDNNEKENVTKTLKDIRYYLKSYNFA